MRKLASIRKIIDIQPIPKADAIEVATVDGWKVVVKKGEFAVGDLVVYCEVDSWVPYELAPFLSKTKEPKEFNGVKGERLRTIKLRGQLSQGLILPIQVAYDLNPADYDNVFLDGDDVTELLGIQKWEKAVPAQLAGVMRGDFPSFIPKTDQERIQNLVKEIEEAVKTGMVYEITEKLEGSSMTCYLRYLEPDEQGFSQWEFGVCSRNIDLLRDDTNQFWKVAIENEIEGRMLSFGGDMAIQGELVGPGIQGNIYGLDKVEFFVYDIYDIRSGVYIDPKRRRQIVDEMGLNHVPVIETDAVLTGSVEEILQKADGMSALKETLREGLVYKQVNGGMTFKTVSNLYLERTDS